MQEYLNRFHQESEERKIRKLGARMKQPIDCVKSANHMRFLLAEVERLYPSKSNINL